MARLVSSLLLAPFLVLSLGAFVGPTDPDGCADAGSDDQLTCQVEDDDSSGLVQLKQHKAVQRSSSKLQNRHSSEGSKEVYTNTAFIISEKGINFVITQAEPILSEMLNGTVVLDKKIVDIAKDLGISAELSNVTLHEVVHAPLVQILVNFTDGGGLHARIFVDIALKGGMSVSSPSAAGDLNIGTKATIDVGLYLSVENETFSVTASSVDVHDLVLTPSVNIRCTSKSFANFIPCAALEALNNGLPSQLVDMMQQVITGMLNPIITGAIGKLNSALADMPTQLPIPGNNSLALKFTPTSVSQFEDSKYVSMQVLLVNAENPVIPEEMRPTPGEAENIFKSSMFGLALTSNVPESILNTVYSDGSLVYVVEPSMLPADSPIHLDTNSLSALFYAPWLKAYYVTTCPPWSPCPVEAKVQSSAPPTLQFTDPVQFILPVSIDFMALYDGKKDFMWRVNTSLRVGAKASIVAGDSSCQHHVKVELDQFVLDWIEVTKTQEDSWVSFDFALNHALEFLCNSVLLPIAQAALAEAAIPLNPITLGNSTFALNATDIQAMFGLLEFKTDVMLAEHCAK
mmetsp:Transcript_128622/g.274434  ORF Transcript_128622/g.274434 Transcript_128622/m.274434 type:complete len:572 (+) Transcript_128622:142-1857(+)